MEFNWDDVKNNSQLTVRKYKVITEETTGEK